MKSLVFLHGFTGSPSDFEAVSTLLALGEPGTPSLIAPWLVGHGPEALFEAVPEEAAATNGFEDEVARLARLLEQHLEQPAHLVGYSLGGRLGLGLLLQHPDLFQSATLIGTHPGLASVAERSSRVESDEHWCDLLLSPSIERFTTAWEAQALFSTEKSLSPEVRALKHARRLEHDPRGLALCLRRTGLGHMPSYLARLPSLRQRVTLMAGVEDTKFLELAETMARLIPKATLVGVEDSGHNVILEQPARVAGLLEKELEA